MSERILGGYRLAEPLGEGGMGTVYRARQIALDREVALKLLRPGVMGEEENQSRFQREMHLAAQLAHPGLVRVLDGGAIDGTGYIAMELVRGKTLVELIVSAAPLAWPFALAVIARIGEALAYLHEHDILHRDIKPSNILISRDGEVKLADFGLARLTGSTLVTEDGAVVGTLQFMAPELLVGDAATRASEMWSVGCVLYVMLTGRMHVEATGSTAFARSVVNDPIRPPGQLAPGVPAAVSQLVLALLDKDPDTREDSAREVAERADELLEKGGYRADTILKPGVLDQIAVWRALSAEATEEERTVTVAIPGARSRPGRGAPASAHPRPAVPRVLPALSVLVVAAVCLVIAFRSPAPGPAAARASPAGVHGSAPPAADGGAPFVPASATPPRIARWHVPASSFPPLKAGGADALHAAAELNRTHPVPLGPEPKVWLHAYRLSVWFADRARPPLPPHLSGGTERAVPPLVTSWVNSQIQDAARQGTLALLSFAIRMVENYPDDPRSWLILGRGLELFDAPDDARVAFAKGLALLGSSALEDAGEPLWQSLGRAITHHPPRDLESLWFRWLGTKQSKFYAWQAMRDAVESRDPALYERLLARGAEEPASAEQAGYYLGLRELEAHASYPRAMAAWKRALAAAPTSRVLATALCDNARAHGDPEMAREAAAHLPPGHPSRKALNIDK